MAATITWEQIAAKCGDDDNVTVTIQELSDGVPTGKQHTVRLHKDRSVAEFKALLKKQILADRAKTAKASTFTGKIDFTDFESYVEQK